MIPAILSCVFVAYLYYSLNAPAGTTSSTSAQGSNSPSERLDAMEKRLQNILERTQK